jgi:serine/threonine-protein kinase
MPSADRHPVEQLAEEFLERQRRGEQPSITEYTQRYPELADEIKDLFPALVVVEQLKPTPDNLTNLGSVAVALPEDTKIERLGDYRILSEIGRGGMGIVFEAEQESLGRRVALKVLPAQALLDPQQQKRFHREAKAAARMHHTNIVPVYGVGAHEGVHYYVMQFIQGLPLDDVLTELRKLHEAKKASSTKDRAGVPVENGRKTGTFKAASALDVAQSLISGRFTPPKKAEEIPNQEDAFASTVTVAEDRLPHADTPDCTPNTLGPEAKSVVQSMGLPPHERPETGSSVTQARSTQGSGVILPGQPEGSALTDAGRRYWQSVARIGMQVADGLEYAHRQGVLHRDIKPSNLLLDTHGTVWITDFGLAKVTEGGDNLTHSGDILGTLRYMAPERFQGLSDARGDIYSLGLTLYEMLTLRPAFEESDRNELISRITQDVPPAPRKLNSAIPRDLETIVLKAIDRERSRRYQAAGSLAEDLRCFLEDKPIHARRVSWMERSMRWCRRKPAVASLLAIVALLLIVVAVGSSAAAMRFRSLAEDERRARQEAESSRKLAERQRERADTNFQQARRAVDDFLTTVSENTLLTVPGMQPVRQELLQSALKYYQEFVRQQRSDDALQDELAAGFARVGKITAQLGSKKDALKAYDSALQIRTALGVAKSEDFALQREIASLHHARGQLLGELGESRPAIEAFDKAADILKQVIQQSQDKADLLSELATVYSDTGRVHAQTHEPLKALTGYTTAFTLQRQLVKEHSEHPHIIQFKYELADQLNRAGDVQSEVGLWVEAARLHDEALVILRDLVKDHPKHHRRDDFQRALAACYESLGSTYDRNSNSTAAAAAFTEALPIRERLAVENPAVTDYQAELAHCHFARGLLQAKSRNPAEAARSLQQAVERQRLAVRTGPQVRAYQLALARQLHELGVVQRRLARSDLALTSYQGARDILETLREAGAEDQIELAQVRAACSALVGQGKASLTAAETAQRDRDAALAVAALRQAIRAGYQDLERLRKDPDLNLLRIRPDFKAAVKDLEDKVKLQVWMDDLEAAKDLAAKEGKDLFIYFSGSDWCPWCILVKKDVFGEDLFARYAARHFVLVELDFPRYKAKPRHYQRNEGLFKRWRLSAFPAVILADAQGRAYANLREAAGASGVERYVELMEKFRKERVSRDALLARAKLVEGAEKARYLDQALMALQPSFIESDYGNLVDQLLQTAGPDQTGLRSKYVALSIKSRQGEIQQSLKKCDWDATIKMLDEIITQLKPSGELEGQMLADRARAEAGLQKWDAAEKDFDRAIALRPNDADLRVDRGNYFTQRGQADKANADYGDALGVKNKAIHQARAKLQRTPQALEAREALSEAYMKLGQLLHLLRRPSEAVATALERAKLWPGMGELHLYNVACELASCVPLAEDDQERQRIADQAMEFLREAVRTGWTDSVHMQKDPDLSSLYSRADFRALVQEMERDAAQNPRAGPAIGPPTAELLRFVGHTQPVESLSVSADGRRALSGGFDRTPRLWDVESGRELHRLDGHTDPVYSVALAPDGRWAISGGEDGSIRLWDAETGKEIRRFEGHTAAVRCVVFVGDGQRALSSSNDGTVRLWNVATGQEVRRLTGHTGPVNAVALSADGRRAVSGGDDFSVRLWDVDTGQEIRQFQGHQEKVVCVAVSPDGRQALSGAQNGFLSLWDTASGRELQRYEGHWSVVHGAAFCPDGRRIVSASSGELIVWDKDTGREVFRIDQRLAFNAIAVIGDGRRALSGTSDGFLRLWTLDEAAARARDLARVGQYARARTAYNRLTAQQPANAHLYAERGRLQIRQQHRDQAIADFTKAIELQVKDSTVWVLRGICYAQQEDWDKVAADYAQALAMRPEAPDPRAGKGVWYHELAAWDLAFEQTSTLRPKDPMLWIARGHVLAETDRWSDAALAYAKAIELMPDEPLLWRIRAALCLQANDTAAYQQVCNQMSARWGKTADKRALGQLVLAGALAPQSGIDSARLLDWAQQAVAAEDQSRIYRHALARAYCRVGKWDQVVRCLHEAAALDPDWDAQALDWMLLSLAYAHLGQASESKPWRDQAEQWHDDRSKQLRAGQTLQLTAAWWDWVEFNCLRNEVGTLLQASAAGSKQ